MWAVKFLNNLPEVELHVFKGIFFLEWQVEMISCGDWQRVTDDITDLRVYWIQNVP